jgi:hypothetical protein
MGNLSLLLTLSSNMNSFFLPLIIIWAEIILSVISCSIPTGSTVRSESRCALRLRYVDLFVNIEVAVEVCCCFTVLSC